MDDLKGAESALNTLTIKEKPPDLQQSESIRRKSKQGPMSGIIDFTRGNAVMVQRLGEELMCSFQIKEKPPDIFQKTPKQPIRGTYLNSQKRKKPNLLSLGTGEDERALNSQQPFPMFVDKEALLSLTNLVPVLPSRVIFILQDLEEVIPKDYSRSSPATHEKDFHIVFDPGAPLESFSYVIPKEQSKKTILFKMLTQRYALLSDLNAKFLDNEHNKELYISNASDVSQFCRKFALKKFFRHGGFLFDKSKTCEPDRNQVLVDIDRLSKIDHCITYHKIREAFSVSNPFDESFDILVYNRILDEQAEYLTSVLDDLSMKLFVNPRKYTFRTYDFVLRVFVLKAQGIPSERMEAHTPETWLFDLWLMRFTVQVDYEPWKHFRNGQNARQANKRHCRMVFEPGRRSWIQMKCFLTQTKIKLMPTSDLPIHLFGLSKDKAYKKSLQGEYNLTLSFNFSNLIPFVADDPDLRTNPFQVEGDDVIMDGTKELELEPDFVAELAPEDEHEAKEILLVPDGSMTNEEIWTSPTTIFDPGITRRSTNNAYQLDLQGKYNVSSSFNVTDLVPYVAEEADLRSNPSQVGEDDEILASKGTEEAMEMEEQLVPEPKEAKGEAKEQHAPEEAEDKDLLHVPLGPMTRSKQARFKQAVHNLLHTIQGQLECAYPTTLVVIQAT